MIAWSSTRTLVAGLALIAVTNAVALISVAYNRSDTESTVRLTQRELAQPYRWRGAHENSGIALSLQWRVLEDEAADSHFFNTFYAGVGGAPLWLDRAKLETLGFAASQLDAIAKGRDRHRDPLSKEVLLVLEFDGLAYQTSLERVRRYAQSESAKGGKEAAEAKKLLDSEQAENSRLFVFDAGLDLAALHAKYPDQARYAIVRGQVQPQLRTENRAPGILGYISELSIHEINVPFDFRNVFESAPQLGENYRPKPLPYEVTVNFGMRLEPWITAAVRK
jgi:hypothetical protein